MELKIERKNTKNDRAYLISKIKDTYVTEFSESYKTHSSQCTRAYFEGAFEKKMNNPNLEVNILYSDGELAGIIAYEKFSDTSVFVFTIFVVKDLRSNGLGEYLMKTIPMKYIYLTARKKNKRALKFYQTKMGGNIIKTEELPESFREVVGNDEVALLVQLFKSEDKSYSESYIVMFRASKPPDDMIEKPP